MHIDMRDRNVNYDRIKMPNYCSYSFDDAQNKQSASILQLRHILFASTILLKKFNSEFKSTVTKSQWFKLLSQQEMATTTT